MIAHPAAELFPLLEEGALKPIVDSMKTSGFDAAKPVIRYRGSILDGRNRLRAAEVAGVAPVFVDLDEGIDPQILLNYLDGIGGASARALAESACIPLPTVRTTLTRLHREGRVQHDGQRPALWSLPTEGE